MKKITTKSNQKFVRIFLFLFISFFAINSCKNSGKKVIMGGVPYTNYNVREKDTVYLDIKGNKYKHLGSIPHGLRTPEQQKLVNAILDVLLNGVVVEDNQEVLKFSKEECLAKGLTLHYYEDLKNNIKTNNSFFKAHGDKDVAKIKASSDSSIRSQSK